MPEDIIVHGIEWTVKELFVYPNEYIYWSIQIVMYPYMTGLVAGAFVDLDNGTTFGRLEWERRIGERHKLEVEVQKLTNVDGGDPLFAISRDSYLQVALSRYF